jgi:2-(1,2-epoxy-1,2-dihydrophenyl)acetyl-CoA isomerase
VVPGERLAGVTRELAQRLAAGPTVAIGLTKRLVNAAEDDDLGASLAAEAALQDVAGRTDDHAEGVAAFSEKRDPTFHGR